MRRFLLDVKEVYTQQRQKAQRAEHNGRRREAEEESDMFVCDLFERLHRFKALETVVVKNLSWNSPEHLMPPTTHSLPIPTPALKLIEFTGLTTLVYDQRRGWFLKLPHVASPSDEENKEI
ncbi:hypothetical protein M422DRAFT_276531 [Sphaerobolus stellatus SS14]|uniref:Uncharacterized protein n=1 Tax=Sphaerobolus stellatus (strain SS14) TaxID=990650 RepID=A0A0C9UC08_SPHS4|nr:hypothetical protein M422DRAFT_276531 [Sphaerobolus stellatus SS14]